MRRSGAPEATRGFGEKYPMSDRIRLWADFIWPRKPAGLKLCPCRFSVPLKLREFVLNPFFNDRERRLRAFWRLLLQFTISSVLWYAASASFALVGRAAFGGGAV